MTAPTKSAANIPVPTRYPKFIDIETASPAVSPSVVAATLMIQKTRVTSGTLLKVKVLGRPTLRVTQSARCLPGMPALTGSPGFGGSQTRNDWPHGAPPPAPTRAGGGPG